VYLEASTKPHVHNLIHGFLINMAFTIACRNFKKGLKMVFGPLGVNKHTNWHKEVYKLHVNALYVALLLAMYNALIMKPMAC
jgi:hypothetical protein